MTGKERMIVESVCVRRFLVDTRSVCSSCGHAVDLQRTLMPLINRLEPGGKRKKKRKKETEVNPAVEVTPRVPAGAVTPLRDEVTSW